MKQNDIVIDSLEHVIHGLELDFRSLELASSSEFEYLDSESETEAYGNNYRVEIYLSEIYKSMYLTSIEYYGEGQQRISDRIEIDLEKEFKIISEETNSLKFLGWTSPTEFQISIAGRFHFVSIIDSKNISSRVK